MSLPYRRREDNLCQMQVHPNVTTLQRSIVGFARFNLDQLGMLVEGL